MRLETMELLRTTIFRQLHQVMTGKRTLTTKVDWNWSWQNSKLFSAAVLQRLNFSEWSVFRLITVNISVATSQISPSIPYCARMLSWENEIQNEHWFPSRCVVWSILVATTSSATGKNRTCPERSNVNDEQKKKVPSFHPIVDRYLNWATLLSAWNIHKNFLLTVVLWNFSRFSKDRFFVIPLRLHW